MQLLRTALGMLLLFVVYVVTARLGLALDAVGGFATLVWPPTGISLAALALFGKRWWPAVAAGAFVANTTAGAPLAVAAGIAVGNTLEAVTGAWLLDRLRFDPAIGRVRDAVAIVLGPAIVAPAISATIGVVSLWAGGVIAGGAAAETWRAWWVGDALGVLVVTSFLVVWVRTPWQRERPRRLVEAAVVVVVLVAIALYIFEVILPGEAATTAIRAPYFVFPPLIWAALRFRQRGATAGTLVVWIAAIVATAVGHDHGPFAAATLRESLLPLQLFTAVIAVATLVLGAAVCERDTAIRARDEFLAVASHELRTPLTTLALQITGLRDKLENGTLPPDKLRARFDILERQSDRLTALASSLLDVSRIMAGHFDLAIEPVRIDEVVREVTGRLRDQATAAGCELVADVADVAPLPCDRMRIEQVVVNLVGNALKFGAGKPIEIRLHETASSVVLRVRDHGIGIAPSDHTRVFRRFERAGGRRRGPGLGLGLWIVHEIVTAMGGTVTVASELGHGAELTVTLPRQET